LADLIESDAALELPPFLAGTLPGCKGGSQDEFSPTIPKYRSRLWSQTDDRILVNLVGCKPLRLIARLLYRSTREVRSRLEYIGRRFGCA